MGALCRWGSWRDFAGTSSPKVELASPGTPLSSRDVGASAARFGTLMRHSCVSESMVQMRGTKSQRAGINTGLDGREGGKTDEIASRGCLVQ